MSKSAVCKSTFEITEHNKRVMGRARKGDLIEFPRGLYSHWAVYIGDGEVIHLTTHTHSGSSKSVSAGTEQGVVEKANFMDVARNSMARINNDMDNKYKPNTPDEIVRIAEDLLTESCLGYHLLRNNCEHFAKQCRYGKKESGQVQSFLKILRVPFEGPQALDGVPREESSRHGGTSEDLQQWEERSVVQH